MDRSRSEAYNLVKMDEGEVQGDFAEMSYSRGETSFWVEKGHFGSFLG